MEKMDKALLAICRRYNASALDVSRCIADGANVNAQHDEGGLTAFHLAAKHNAADVMEVLLSGKGARPYATNNRGLTARDFAQSLGHTETLTVLDAFDAKQRTLSKQRLGSKP